MAEDAQRLIAAAGRGDAGEVKALLARGAPIEARDGRGRTALLPPRTAIMWRRRGS